jgi:hypothetical protein
MQYTARGIRTALQTLHIRLQASAFMKSRLSHSSEHFHDYL